MSDEMNEQKHLNSDQAAEWLTALDCGQAGDAGVSEHLAHCSLCRSKLAAGEAWLAWTAITMDEDRHPACPSDATLASYLDDRLELEDREEINAHLGVCADCREVVDSSIPNTSRSGAPVAELHCGRPFQVLIDLACNYMNCSMSGLAEKLNVPPNTLAGIVDPPYTLTCRLAELLSWPVRVVFELIDLLDRQSETDGRETQVSSRDLDFETVYKQAIVAYKQGDWLRGLELAQELAAIAKTARQRALACFREFVACEKLGNYDRACEAIRKGLMVRGISQDIRLMLEVNLAHVYHLLSESTAARGMAELIIGELRELEEGGQSPDEKTVSWRRTIHAYAVYVRGMALWRLAWQQEYNKDRYLRFAKSDLTLSCRAHREMSEELGHHSKLAIANICVGATIAIDVDLGLRNTIDGVEELRRGVDNDATNQDGLVGDLLESYGWWCVFGGELALRHALPCDWEREAAVFVGKGLTIARRVNSWALSTWILSVDDLRIKRQKEAGNCPDVVIAETDRILAETCAVGQIEAYRRKWIEYRVTSE